MKHGGNVAAAKVVGKKLAESGEGEGHHQALAFDRGAFRFHGRIAALAVAATEAGLVCTDLESMKARHRGRAPPKLGQRRRARARRRAKGKPKGEKKGEGKPKGEGDGGFPKKDESRKATRNKRGPSVAAERPRTKVSGC